MVESKMYLFSAKDNFCNYEKDNQNKRCKIR